MSEQPQRHQTGIKGSLMGEGGLSSQLSAASSISSSLNPCCLPQNRVIGGTSAALLTKSGVTAVGALAPTHLLPAQVLTA